LAEKQRTSWLEDLYFNGDQPAAYTGDPFTDGSAYSPDGPHPHRFVRCANGDLFALIATSTSTAFLYKSVDNGYSWEQVKDSDSIGVDMFAAYNVTHADLQVIPIADRIYVIISQTNGGDETNAALMMMMIDPSDTTNIGGHYNVVKAGASNQPAWGRFTTCSNNYGTYIIVIETTDAANPEGDLTCISFRHDITFNEFGQPSSAAYDVTDWTQENTYTWLPVFSAVAEDDNTVHVIVEAKNTVGDNNYFYYVQYDGIAGTWGTPVQVTQTGATGGAGNVEAYDVGLARDSYGTLAFVASRRRSSEYVYGYSTDDGANWTTGELTAPTSASDYVDAMSSLECHHPDILASSDGGFLIGTTWDSSSVPTPYLYQLTTSDGSTYTLGTPVQALDETSAVPWLAFFKPEGNTNMSLDRPEMVRVAYQKYEGTAEQDRTEHYHQLLEDYAFAEAEEYTVDTASTGQVVVGINILGGVTDNIDYYDEGVIGDHTTSYLNSFEDKGTYVIFRQYEPLSNSRMSDVTAYEDPVVQAAQVFIDPEQYDFPAPQIESADLADWIEQDIRRIHIPPNFFLSRTWVTNEGNHKKRTVWTVELTGNEYEVTQVVPRFVRGQIVFYEANLYVIGPSRNPFTREILPSET